jgi:hypothetical protein
MHFISVSAPLTLYSTAGTRRFDAPDYTHPHPVPQFEIFSGSIRFSDSDDFLYPEWAQAFVLHVFGGRELIDIFHQFLHASAGGFRGLLQSAVRTGIRAISFLIHVSWFRSRAQSVAGLPRSGWLPRQ